jgi:hypothetical protein
MSFSDTYETHVLTYLFTATSVTRPTAWYVGLQTSSNTDGTPGTEVSGNGYVRKAVTLTVSGNLATNGGDLEWSAATGNWGTVTSLAVYDAQTGGNQIAHSDLTAPKVVATGDVFRIPAGLLDINLD